ncbi:hypothetical protein C7974DRAFT_224288 [Boeremia exigua]|uniref:uncharacterized protein n=1 Tax=Boeremia exigua TaxID=749465 RepID=UPI001E8CE9CB|nr:uncharacterized protein C7974DRAFT_224288 [Boeremia exigua]KAH6619985.1 hypothetical protein C7974DRAFT_224288 [Boeremia exigua]
MDMLRLPSFARLAIISLLLAPTHAQNATTPPDYDSCRIFDPKAPVNGTGSLNIHWSALMMDPTQNDWTFSLTYNETRNSSGTIHQWESYISAPEGNEATACTFMFAALNKTSSSTKRYGCDGVIDDACTNVLREIVYLGGDCSWPAPIDEYADRVRQACGTDILSTGMRTNLPVEFSNNTTSCSQSNPPGSSSPQNYRTYLSASQSLDGTNWNTDKNTSDFLWYDIHAKQTVPFVVAAEFLGGVAETKVVCVAPNRIAEGGRTPVERSAASVSRQSTFWSAVIVTSLASTLMVLA